MNNQANGRAGGLALKDAGENLHLIRFTPLGRVAAGSGTAAIEIRLNIRLRQRHAGRTAIDDTTDRNPMAFAKRGHTKEFSDAISRHISRGTFLQGFSMAW